MNVAAELRAGPRAQGGVGRRRPDRPRPLAKPTKGRPVVRNVTVTLHRGEAVGLLGPNGAGKTTTFYMIVGLVKPDTGVDQPGRRGYHQAADVSPRPSGHRLSAAGSQRVSRPECRAERHGRAGGDRTRCRDRAT